GMAAQFVDYDNDGWLDLVVAGEPIVHGSASPGVFLLHNDGRGRFEDRSNLLPAAVHLARGAAVAVADIDDDGDEDLLVADADGNVRLLRNDGGNENLAVRVELKGLRTGSGKNNDFGIGARLELRAGKILQTRVVTGRVTHFGLGPHLKADVLRVEWTNGVPETVYFPGTDADVLERELLKGSCPFLYTWDGQGFRFMTDVMWRSALGMPLGLMGSTSTFAPAGASQQYLRIPGSALRPRDGHYVLQLTEELWETVYADEIRLLAVDHPDSVDVFVDERFVPPGPVELRLYQVVRPQAPVSAVDNQGNDVLPALRQRDDLYVSNLTPVQYQGLVEPHELILDLGDDVGRAGTFLFLRGWIYPGDASINVALSQQPALKPIAPSLEVRDRQGRWKTAIPNIGFPSGKDKTIVVDLAGIFASTDHHVRIRTNMQIYWDQAFVSVDAAKSPVRVTPLTRVSADLHYRGFSRTYRKGSRYGPHWFAYDDVSKVSPWRPIDGAFTRFGDVLPLVSRADDMYIIMAAGDEITLQFDAASASALPPGWKRDFLLYTDGWVKDSDLNTAFGTTVGPLPFHGMKEYPYAPGESYPADARHQRYLRDYDTRLSERR
ncbi:MAG: FG-GAP-like repeat-containing protein, partial [Acidobacteriota bacterium]|nr:FG-GAP-like repeat-containing protein [Acidobacteriota bacterium]